MCSDSCETLGESAAVTSAAAGRYSFLERSVGALLVRLGVAFEAQKPILHILRLPGKVIESGGAEAEILARVA